MRDIKRHEQENDERQKSLDNREKDLDAREAALAVQAVKIKEEAEEAAKEEAERIKAEAKKEAEQIVDTAKVKAEIINTDMEKFKAKVEGIKKNLQTRETMDNRANNAAAKLNAPAGYNTRISTRFDRAAAGDFGR